MIPEPAQEHAGLTRAAKHGNLELGCADSPESIKAAYDSPLEYRDYNCNQIGQELGRMSRRMYQVTGQRQDVADDDAAAMGIGLVLFWPALFFISGDDHTEELARPKGEYDADKQAAIQKECDVADQIEEARQLREERAEKKGEAAPKGAAYLGAGRNHSQIDRDRRNAPRCFVVRPKKRWNAGAGVILFAPTSATGRRPPRTISIP